MRKFFNPILIFISFASFTQEIAVPKDSVKKVNPQETTLLPNSELNKISPVVSPLAPNTAAVARHGEYAVKKYNGIADIPIEIFKIKVGNTLVPITLNYHPGGNKVTDIASFVGLGWSLNVGGQISRNLVGISDENFGYLDRSLVTGLNPSDVANCETTREQLRKYSEDLQDTGADIFSYNLPNKSGRFILTPEVLSPIVPGEPRYGIPQEPMLIPAQKIKVSYTRNQNFPIPSFTLVDTDGFKYIFDKQESATPSSTGNGFVNAWQLGGIEGNLPNQKVIFDYESVTYNSSWDISNYQVLTHSVLNNGANPNVTEGLDKPNNQPNERTVNTGINAKKIKNIYFPNGKVVFEYETSNRNDLADTALDKIVIYGLNADGVNYTKLKSFDLIQSYFTGSSTRLRLDEVRMLNKNDVIINKYTFGYNLTDGLPEMNSKSRDIWGYFNGKNNTSLIPPVNVSVSLGNTNTNVTVGNADRTTDEIKMQAWVLTQVNYPTGGYSTFHYEANRYLNTMNNTITFAGGLRTFQIKNYSSPSATPIIKTFKYGSVSTGESGYGRLNANLSTAFLQSEQQYLQIGFQYKQIVVASGYSNNIFPFDGSPVVYSQVTEYDGTEANNNGKIIETYRDERSDVIRTIPSSTKTFTESFHWDRSQLLTKNIYSATGGLKYSLTNTYANLVDGISPSIGILVHHYKYENDAFTISCATKITGEYYFDYYSAKLGNTHLIRTEERTFDDSNSANYVDKKSETDYNAYFQPIESRSYNSDGEISINRFRFVTDINNVNNGVGTNGLALRKLLQNNQITTPIEEISFKKKSDNSIQVLGGKYNAFKTLTSNNIDYTVADNMKILEIPLSPALNENDLVLAYIDGVGLIKSDVKYKERITYGNYDNHGNLLDYKKNDGPTTAYTYSTTNKDNIFHTNVKSQTLNSGGLPPFITTYNYEVPLVGLSSITDYNGKATNYEYDDFQRLKYIKDENNAIIAAYCYNYAGQAIDCGTANNTGQIEGPQLALINSGGPLPLNLISFVSLKKQNDAQLIWNTAEEVNTKSFDIEHSLDAKNWKFLSTIDAKGGKKSKYEFIHATPPKGLNYYKLKMNDADGKFEYSKIVNLAFGGKGWIYPNPLPNNEKLHLDEANFSEIAQVELLGVNGKILYKTSKPQKAMELNNYATGKYILKLTYNDGSIINYNLIKQ